MKRKLWGALCAAILSVGFPALGVAENGPAGAQPVELVGLKAVAGTGGSELEVRASGPFDFTSYQPHARTAIIDLAGVVGEPGRVSLQGELDWLAHHRFLPFRNARSRPVLRLELSLAQNCLVEISRPEASILVASCPVMEGTAAPPRAAPTPAVSQAPVEVQQVKVERRADGVSIRVQASGPLTYETLVLENPSRLVVDLPHALLVARTRRIAVEQHPILGVRLSQFKKDPPVTRVVVDLVRMLPYEIETPASGLRLILRSSEASAPPSSPALPLPAVNLFRGVSAAETEEPAAEGPEPVLVASLAPTLPSTMSAPAKEPLPTPVEITPPVERAQALPQQPVPAPTESAPAAATAAEAAAQRFTGEPISVNLKDVDLKDFFRLVHEISGLNIVLDPNVSGTVTLVLIDVPWDQALDIVLRNNGLGSTLEGNVLRIATLGSLKKEQEDARDLARARAEAVDPVTVTRQLSYAKASDFEATLRRFLSSRGELIRDDRTNTIIIRDIPSVIPAIDNLIQQLDRKSLQVEIEARVVSATRAFSRELGSQLAVSFSTTGGRSIFGGALGASQFSSFFPPPLISGTPTAPGGVATATSQPLVTDLRAVSPTFGFLFGHRSTNFALDSILTAAEERNIAKVLSKPRVVTQNNISAEVKQGTRIPIQTVVNNTISTQFIDVVLKLTVKPQITAEGTVFLDISIENTQIDPGIARINGVPALSTQAATTQVLVTDGGTVVVGGVMVTNNSTTIDQVPLLGSIPIIGHLFKRSRVETSTQELLFFITPRILQS